MALVDGSVGGQPAQPGQHRIEDDQVHRHAGEQGQRRLGVVGGEGPEAAPLQEPGQPLTDRGVVLHHQDRAPGLGSRGPRAPLGLHRYALDGREANLEGRPLGGDAAHLHHPLVLADDAVHHRQTQAGAAPRSLGGEEGLEDSLQGAGWMPTPVSRTVSSTIFRPGHHSMPGGELRLGLHVAGADGERAALGHGVPGVDAEVHQHLLQLRRITGDRPQRRREGRSAASPARR